MTIPSRLTAEHITLSYGQRTIVSNLSVALPDKAFTAIIGPNGCGKSTLLRALARLLAPKQGQVILDQHPLSTLPTKQIARTLGVLPQSPRTPEAISVEDLVARGRHPHRGPFSAWSVHDEQAVQDAMTMTGISALAHRPVETLSGGQRQRAWIAMVLAQQTAILLLDEPTTWLDIAHQIDVLNLLGTLTHQYGHTLVAVLHDLNQACRYADHLLVMKEGQLVAQGPPSDIMTSALVEEVFDLRCVMIDDPVAGTPMIVPCHPG